MPHRNNNVVLEGMRAGDLTDLVLPLLSVDEFESKIDEDAVVIGFYVTDKDASDDLNRFIQRSPVEILDSDISPAPDQNGHYMVFVELLNNRQAAANIIGIAEEVSALCGLDRWDAQIRGREDSMELEAKTLAQALAANQAHDRSKSTTTKESVETLLRESDLSELVVLSKNSKTTVCIALSPGSNLSRYAVLENRRGANQLTESGVDLSFEALSASNQVSRALGSNWNVETHNGGVQTWRRADGRCLTVKPS